LLSHTDKPLVIFVHGDNKTFRQAVVSGLDIQELYNVSVVVFAWPSRQKQIMGSRNFQNSKKNVVQSDLHFHKLFQFISEFSEKHSYVRQKIRFSLFLHSLGNMFMKQIVENKQLPTCELFDNVVLNSAAVPQKHHKQWIEQLQIQKRIYITANYQDFNLKGARIFTSAGKQLGERYEHPLAENAEYVNFTKAIGFRFPTYDTHTFFLGNIPAKSQIIRSFYHQVFRGESPNLNDQQSFSLKKDGRGYNIHFKTKQKKT